MHQLGSLLSATIEYYAADQIEMCYSEKKKEKKIASESVPPIIKAFRKQEPSPFDLSIARLCT